MKKHYDTPSVEKLAFRYRDQVVAASGGDPITQGGNTPSVGEQILSRIFQGIGIDGCENYECTSLANYG